MFVDACAIVSIMAEEDSAATYEEALSKAPAAWTSALAAWEAIMVLSRADQLNCRFVEADGAVVEWIEARDIALRDPPSPRETLAHAVAVAEKHGLGKRVLSNFDCFHYAAAKATKELLLTLNRASRATDVETMPKRLTEKPVSSPSIHPRRTFHRASFDASGGNPFAKLRAGRLQNEELLLKQFLGRSSLHLG